MAALRVASIVEQVRTDALGLVQAAASLDAIFEEHGLAYNQQINPRQVGLDPSIRDTYGVNHEDVHALAHGIAFIVGSLEDTHKATCVE